MGAIPESHTWEPYMEQYLEPYLEPYLGAIPRAITVSHTWEPYLEPYMSAIPGCHAWDHTWRHNWSHTWNHTWSHTHTPGALLTDMPATRSASEIKEKHTYVISGRWIRSRLNNIHVQHESWITINVNKPRVESQTKSIARNETGQYQIRNE